MFERIEYAFTDFCLCIWFSIVLNITTGAIFLPGILLAVLIAITDVILFNGEKYGTKSYLYLALNKMLTTLFVIMVCIIMNNAIFWLSLVFYLFETIRVTICQIEIIQDDLLYINIMKTYEKAIGDLKKNLSNRQKILFDNLQELIDEEHAYVFVSQYSTMQIQKLLELDLKVLALLIQKDDFEKLNELIKK